jgi:short-subunit dehydrogenase
LERVAAELREVHGIEVETISADLAVREDVMRVADRIEDPARPIDWLINNAGFGLHSTVLDRSEIDIQARAFDVMCLAVLILGGAAGRAMRARGSGRIVNVASTSAAIYTGNYSAVKAWARTYSTALQLELRGTGVTVTGLLPGWVRTEFHDRAGINASKLPGFVWIEADKLVRSCLADAEKGRIESIPDLKWKIAMFIGDHGPRGLARLVSRMLTASRKKH